MPEIRSRQSRQSNRLSTASSTVDNDTNNVGGTSSTNKKSTSRTTAPSSGSKLDPNEREAFNARMSDRRKQRREERRRKATNLGATAGGTGDGGGPSSYGDVGNSSTRMMKGGKSTTSNAGGGGGGGNVILKGRPRRRSNYGVSPTLLCAGLLVLIGIAAGWWISVWCLFGGQPANGGNSNLNNDKNGNGNGNGNGGVVEPGSLLSKMKNNFVRGGGDGGGNNNNNNGNSGGWNMFRNNNNKNNRQNLLPTGKEVVDMRELNAQLPFKNEDGGAWKQGWDVQPVPLKSNDPLKIFVVPHSHCDPGWIKTFDEYFQSQTKGILTTVIQALEKDPRRKFIWAEISYFEWWWREQNDERRDVVRRLLKNKQFEFVTGGWVQPDEANTQLYAMEIQLQEGHDFIRETFGEEYIPKYGWSIDPFGYSPTMAYLLKKYNFEGMLIQRVHYAVKKELALHKQLEFVWRQTWDDAGSYDIFTHVMPFFSYDVPHTCGPDPSVCCQFDFARMREVAPYVASCPWHKQPVRINDGNVEVRAMMLLDQYRKKAALYRSNAVIAPLGDDFRYRNLPEAEYQYENYQKIFDYINNNVEGVEIQFGTLSEYFETVIGTFRPPILKGSFFTYADRDNDYWSGYFTSRIYDKALDRVLERVLYAATSMGASRTEMQDPRRALSLFQHHDGVTGTAKTPVVVDYAKRIHTAIRKSQDWMIKAITSKSKMMGQTTNDKQVVPCWQTTAVRGLSQNLCSNQVLLFNPLESEQTCGDVVVQPRSTAAATLPCETPGPLRDTKVDIRFDAETGLMTSPVREQWMVWEVQKGGAYLFFPGHLVDYNDMELEISQGGYVVYTPHWKRTVVEKSYPTSYGTIATVIDFIYETDLKVNNHEWLVRFSADIKNDGVFHTDLNGYNFDTHYFREDMPIQSQVFPMPTHASIEDADRRLTILSEHAQGTASLEDGSIDIWLDRRLLHDDGRGLEQGVMDNVPTRTRLRLVLERDGYKHGENTEFEITSLCKLMWKELNHPLEMFGYESSSSSTNNDNNNSKENDLSVYANKKFDPFKNNNNKVRSSNSRTNTDTRKVQQVPNEKKNNNNTNNTEGGSKYRYKVPFVFMVYKRNDYFEQVIDSLRNSDFPKNDVPIIISHDGHATEMVEYVNSIKSEFHVIQLFHPHSCLEHPFSFPGDDPKLNENYAGDAYGHKREGHVTCCKHHFTWMMNQVFAMIDHDDDNNHQHDDEYSSSILKDVDGYLFLEEDYIVAPTIYETIQNGFTYIDEQVDSDTYFGLTVDPTDGYANTPPRTITNNNNVDPSSSIWFQKRFITGPMAFRKNIFHQIKQHSKEYCTFDEYNWDWSLVHLMGRGLVPYKTITPSVLQVAHIGVEGGLHSKDIKIQQLMNIQKHQTLQSFHGIPTRHDGTTTNVKSWLDTKKVHEKGYGGWGHPADHEHCITLFS